MIFTVAPVSVAERDKLRHALDLCIVKTRINIRALADRPATWALAVDGDYTTWDEGFQEIGNWTSSFFTGMALIAYEQTGDDYYLQEVLRLEPQYQAKVGEHAADTMHDIGFLYSLHSVALYKLTGEAGHRVLALKAAQILADRFIAEGNYIRAWGRMDETDTEYAGLAIIDCMMNLALLYWASEVTSDSRFKEIAIRHSDMTLERFIREDGSVYHSFRFDRDGKVVGGDNYCGRSIESHWARGATWAIYGFAMGYRYTGDVRYLEASQRLAKKFISHLDDEIVPIWDFRLDADAPHIRDSSAAAVAACGFQELESLGAADDSMVATKHALLAKLSSDAYLDKDLTIKGLLKEGEVGDGVGRAQSAYTSWGDYFFMEALARELGVIEKTWW